MIADRPIGVAGAGSIGCFVGGMWAAAGRRVALLARPRVIGEIEGYGLRLTSFDGHDRSIASNRLMLSEHPSIFENAGGVQVAVKRSQKAELAVKTAMHAQRVAVRLNLHTLD